MPSDMRLLNSTLSSPGENLALDEALLEEREATGGPGILRFWESPLPFVVLGYANRLREEVEQPACLQLGIPIFRRCSGGGTVVQGPGCFNYSLILPLTAVGPDATITSTNCFVMRRNALALSRLLKRDVRVAGHTDLALDDRKFSGNAQRRKREWFLFHGTLLLEFDLELISRLLRSPPRQPDYRRQRDHAAFVMNLPLDRATVQSALAREWGADTPLESIPTDKVERLVAERYSRDDWNLKW
jgi:lipoate-protein ligase A